MENKKKVSIRVFRAIDEPSTCEEFMEGHANVLRDIGINVNKLTSANIAWSRSPESFVFIARSHEDGKLMGGIRLDIGGGSLSLPIEDAVGPLDKSIYDVVKSHASNGGTAELCGLWISSKVAGMGIAGLLIRSGISVTNQFKLNTILILCSGATLSMLLKMGCVVNTAMGNNGTFYYPKEDLVATALIIPNLQNIETADEANRKNILDLRANPKQTSIITGPKGEMEIDYDLIIKNNNFNSK